MNINEERIVERLMDSMHQGIVYVDRDGIIRRCNQVAKEITGIVFNAHVSHDAGKVTEGDIIIIADNRIGVDDGGLTGQDLKALNIHDKEIRDGDMLVATGIFGNEKISPQYKFLHTPIPNMALRLDVNYVGFHIIASVDMEKKETLIQVNDAVFRLAFYNSVGNVVIVDGTTGNIKFFQARGYSTRNEDLGWLLRGASWQAKTTEDLDVDVVGTRFLDLFDESALSKRLFAILKGHASPVNQRLYEINKIPFICNIIPWGVNGEVQPEGAFLLLQDAKNLEQMLDDRNEIIRQMEAKEEEYTSAEQAFPKDAFKSFAGKSSKVQEVKYMAWKAAQSRFNVIITGESGTGKSKLAREIHMASKSPGGGYHLWRLIAMPSHHPSLRANSLAM